MNITTGVETDVVVGLETNFGQAASSINEALGYNSKWSFSEKRNYVKFFDLGLRTFLTAEDVKWEGTFDVDFALANELFWKYVFCDGDGTGGDPFVFDAAGNAKSMTVKVNDRREVKFRRRLGACVNDFSMAFSAGEEIKCKMSGLFASMEIKQTGVTRASLGIDGVTPATDDPFTVAMADVQISATSNYFGLLQKLDLKIANELVFYWAFNGRYAHTPKQHNAIGAMTLVVKKSDGSTVQAQDAIRAGQTSGENLTVTITITDGTRTITMTISGAYLDEESSSYGTGEDVDETLTFIFSSISTVLAGF